MVKESEKVSGLEATSLPIDDPNNSTVQDVPDH